MDAETKGYRSGLFNTTLRFSVNLVGGPAMDVADFRKWQQKTIVGVSLRVVAPIGQYDPTKHRGAYIRYYPIWREFQQHLRWLAILVGGQT
jgi:hypothetical protein